ncbi:MAG: ADP-ribosylglycohydrolase family protein [Clostridia bacterium]|nr:ADP-ribosylglycohydrolase family protein [Clostridia bacterium]
MKKKIRAVMLGHAVADALGVPVEFCSRAELDASPLEKMEGYGTYPVPAGSWSDDTSMSIAALDSLAGGEVDFDDIMRRFGEWYYKSDYTPTGKLFDIGGTCSRAIDRYFRENLPPTECGPKEASSNGNGSLMRIHPFSLYAYARGLDDGETDKLIDSASALTHGHERSRLACRIYNLILFELLDKPSKASIEAALAEAREKYKASTEIGYYERLLSPGFEATPRAKIKSSGYVVDTLEAAVWCLLNSDTYRECALMAANLGEDTDTVAAIAGGLAGALYGIEAIPREWLGMLKRLDYLVDMCDRAIDSWCK